MNVCYRRPAPRKKPVRLPPVSTNLRDGLAADFFSRGWGDGKANLFGGYLGDVRPRPPLRCPSSLAIELSKLPARDLARAEFRRRAAVNRTAEGYNVESNVQGNEVEKS